jgi:transcription termination factor Rho
MRTLFRRRSERKNVETNEETTTSTPAEETAPVRRRASRRVTAAAGATSETVAVESPAPAADAAPAAAEAPAAEAPAAEAPAAAPKKRATRSRKKPVEEPTAEAATSEAAEPTAAPEAAAEEAPVEAPKKRATRSRKKAVEAPVEETPAAETPAEQPAAEAAASDAAEPAATEPAAEAAPTKRGRNRRAQVAEAAPEAEQGETAAEGAKSEGAKPENSKAEGSKPESDQGAGDGEKQGRNRRGRGRAQKGEAAESSEAGEQNTTNDEGKGRGQAQNGGDKNDKNGDNASRSSRTRQRDRKRRGQSDDLEPEITEDDVLLPIAGVLDVLDNYAFVRTSGYLPGTSDVYVSLGQVKKYGLRRGDAVVGAIRQPREGDGGGRQKYNAIVKIDSVNARPVEENEKRADIAELTPVFPQERLRLETAADRLLGRAIDVVAPIGLGQRSLLVLPARQAGVPVLAELAQAVSANKPEAHLMLVLADAQPEEATQLQRTIPGEVVVATFDRPAEDQATIAELAIERAKRLVELGHDVVVLVDSLNRLARAYAQAQHTAARPGLDEIDEFALGQIKRLLAAARNVENGGSLTVLATVHAKTGIDADKMLLREVRAVVNNEIRFEKSLPGLPASLTRNADAMLSAGEAAVLSTIRAALSDDDASEKVLERLRATESNAALLAEIQRSGKF